MSDYSGRFEFEGMAREGDPSLEALQGRVAEQAMVGLPDHRHDRIAEMEGQGHTAFELYVQASPSVPFCDWELPTWFSRPEHNADIAYVVEGCTAQGCAIDLEGMAKNQREQDWLDSAKAAGVRFDHELK